MKIFNENSKFTRIRLKYYLLTIQKIYYGQEFALLEKNELNFCVKHFFEGRVTKNLKMFIKVRDTIL